MFTAPPPDIADKVDKSTFNALQAQVTNSAPLGPFTIAELPAPGADYLYRIANVTDLFGNRKGRVRCDAVGDFHFWQPISSDSFADMALTGDTIIQPLASATTISLSGGLLTGVTRTLTLGTQNGWPGAVKEIRSNVTLGLGSVLNIAGTGLGSAVSLLLGGYRKFGLDYAGGQLAWRLLT